MSRNFGKHFTKHWPDVPPNNIPEFSQYGKQLLEQCQAIEKPQPLKISELLNNSNQFPIKFPIDTCRIKKQPSNRHELIEKQAASGYPIIHERTLWLYTQYLEYMHTDAGTESESRVYNKLTIIEFIDRLLKKRCVSFYGKNDKYLLLSGEHGYSCYKESESSSVTTNQLLINDQCHPRSLDNLISYNEIKLSALLSVSSGTEFINDGTRKNSGIVECNKNRIEQSGYIIGIIGARLSKPNFMEFQDIIISKQQNTIENGYGGESKHDSTVATKTEEELRQINRLNRYRKMWNTFYGENDRRGLYSETEKNQQRFDNCKNKNYIFDNVMMKKRYTISFDTLLLDAEARAIQQGKRAYIHVIGIGLGVWQYADHQEEIFLQTFEQRIKQLSDKLKNIGWIHFSWFNTVKCGDLYHNNIVIGAGTNIKILMSKRNPAEKLIGDEYKNAFIMVSYAWDGNALPGNEFWEGKIASTGDSAAAACSLITELHNPHINKTMICGDNLHIASIQFGGVLHISDYVKKILCNS